MILIRGHSRRITYGNSVPIFQSLLPKIILQLKAKAIQCDGSVENEAGGARVGMIAIRDRKGSERSQCNWRQEGMRRKGQVW